MPEAAAGAPHGPLFKTTIVIWSELPGEGLDLEHLAREATIGDAYCSRQSSELVERPELDPAWGETEFFNERGA